ncbi:MAG: serine hydroxymethyltransferase, partial [Ignavibacteriaceae bacterium]
EYCDAVTSTTHKTLRGPRGGIILIGKDKENPWGLTTPKGDRVKMMSELIDSMVMPGIQGGPLMHIIMAKGVSFGEALSDSFKEYVLQVRKNAQLLAAKLIEYNFNVVSGGTDNHLMLIDLSNKNITGKQAEIALEEAGITVNKNMVPFDKRSPFVTSGIRIGTSALTSRGMKEKEMETIAEIINKAINNFENKKILSDLQQEVKKLTAPFPLFADMK